MLSVEEAKTLLSAGLKRGAIVEIPVAEAFGSVTAEDIYAPVDMPLFDASAVDGYALAYKELNHHDHFEIIAEIKAGDNTSIALQPGQCVRLYTGAMVPKDAKLIVMQEFVTEKDGQITLNEDFKPGKFIRYQGSQIKKGEPALQRNTFINPGVIGFLASMGISHVKVYKRPAVSILVTGNEIIPPGHVLEPGQIYESNSMALRAVLAQQHLEPDCILSAKDNREDLDTQLDKATSLADVILITGGISVGKYDLVKDALKDLGAECIFYKVAQRPGKPLWAGKLGEKLIFALPGNPASVLVCFYEYAYPAIRYMRGYENINMPALKLKLLKEIHDPGIRASFIRGRLLEDGVMPLEKQDSGMMMSFAGGNVLIYVPAEREYMPKDEIVEVHLLPFEA